MSKFWNVLEVKGWNPKWKIACFLVVNCLLWLVVPYAIMWIGNGLISGFGTWNAAMWIVPGYCMVGIGFFGGCIYLMRKEIR